MMDAILFDFDGVLVDSVNIKRDAFAKLYVEYGEDIVKKVLEHQEINTGMYRFEKFRYFHREFLGKELLPRDLEILNKKFSRLVKQSVIGANEIPHAKKTLDRLSKRIPLHLISATPEEELKQIISARKMGGYFWSIHGSPLEKVTHIVNIIEQYNYKSQNVLMIGDTVADYTASLKAGITFLGYHLAGASNPFPESVSVITDLTVLNA